MKSVKKIAQGKYQCECGNVKEQPYCPPKEPKKAELNRFKPESITGLPVCNCSH